MRHLIGMGELLIDFIPQEVGESLEHVKTFNKMAGGAPANVCACFAKLGGRAFFMGQVGDDPFGHFLAKTLEQASVDISYLHYTHKAKTSLAFVSIHDEGERDFMFYRDPSADQLFEPKQVDKNIFEHAIFHFCSVGLKEYPLKYAHLEAIKYAKKNGSIISFDPNLRFSLWDNHQELKKTVLSFIPYAHILKLSVDELIFLTETKSIDKGISILFNGSVQIIVLTRGKEGSSIYLKHETYHHPSFDVNVVDTTGAGDAFIGAFLYQYAKHEHHTIDYEKVLAFASATSAIVVSHFGAIPSLPTIFDVEQFMLKYPIKL